TRQEMIHRCSATRFLAEIKCESGNGDGRCVRVDAYAEVIGCGVRTTRAGELIWSRRRRVRRPNERQCGTTLLSRSISLPECRPGESYDDQRRQQVKRER